jgi:hypothetical protein
MRAAAVAFDRYGKDIHSNVAQRARHDFGAPEGSQKLLAAETRMHPRRHNFLAARATPTP